MRTGVQILLIAWITCGIVDIVTALKGDCTQTIEAAFILSIAYGIYLCF